MPNASPLPHEWSEPLAAQAHGFDIPGLAIAVAAPGRQAQWVWGVEAAGSDRPVTSNTWFSWASLAKHVTAAAVLDLARQGRIDLAAPVEHYLQDLPPRWHGRPVLSLMQHVSGLPEYLSYSGTEAVPEGRADFMRLYAHLEPAFAAGEAWIYTNTNYILLGFLVAQQSGLSFAEAVQSLFDRHGCPGATVASPAWTRAANAAARGQDARDAASARREVIGDGDASFTVGGAATWLTTLLEGRLLDAQGLQTMFAPAQLATGRPSPYGCGWFTDHTRGAPVGYHGGHYDGWTTMAYLAPQMGCGVIAMCNLAPGNTRAIRHLALSALEGFAPGSTPLSLPPLADGEPALTRMIRSQLLRRDSAPDPACFAQELLRVMAHGSPVRNVINLWAGVEPQRFELVEVRLQERQQQRRYRLTYADRIEHLQVGVTDDGRIYWAWPL